MHTLHVCLLGDFRLIYGNDPLTTVNTSRLQALFAYLLLHRQAPQSRQHVAFQFWPDSSEKQAHTNLRKLLFQLRNALPDPDRFLTQDHLSVQWRPDAPYTLDVGELTQLLTRVGSTTGKATAHPQYTAHYHELAQVATLYQGELLPSCFDEWLLPVRQQLHREVMQALELLINLSEHQREYRAGIRYAQRLLGLDPLHEAGYRRLMQLHALNGDRAAAIHNYHACVTILQQELGVEPDEEARGLYEQAETLSVLGLSGIYSGAPLDKIEVELQQSLAVYQRLGDPAGQAGALGMLAYIIYTQREGNYDLGIRYCEQALQLVTDGWDAERFAKGNLGCLWYFQGNYARAKAYLEGELAIVQQVQNWGPESGSRMELGCLYMAMGDYGTAQVHFERSLHLCRANDAKQQYRVKLEGHLARFYLLTGDKTRAAAHAEAAVNFARKLNDPRIQGDAFTRCGRVLVSQNRLAEGAELFQQALICFRQMEQWNHTMMPMAGLADIALRQGDPVQARVQVEEVLVYLQTHQLDRTDEELYVYMTCYQVLKTENDPHAATLLQLAYEQLQVRAFSLETESARTLFWSAPSHNEVLATLQNPRAIPTTR